MIPSDNPDDWSPEESEAFDRFQDNAMYVLRTLLSCCAVRNTSRSDEVNSAVDVMLIAWLFSSHSLKYATDIDYVSSATTIYKTMLEQQKRNQRSPMVAYIREKVENDCGLERLQQVSNTVDFAYSSRQKDSCGHSWRENLSGATVDVILHSITEDISPSEIEAAMLIFVLSEKPLTPIQFGEFMVSRFRSRIDSYKEAIEELQMRLSSPVWN